MLSRRNTRFASRSDADELEDIRQEMIELLSQAKEIVQGTGDRHLYEQAKSYWIGHIATALSNESEYMGKSMYTMEDTVESMRDSEDEIGEDDDEELGEVYPDDSDLPSPRGGFGD